MGIEANYHIPPVPQEGPSLPPALFASLSSPLIKTPKVVGSWFEVLAPEEYTTWVKGVKEALKGVTLLNVVPDGISLFLPKEIEEWISGLCGFFGSLISLKVVDLKKYIPLISIVYTSASSYSAIKKGIKAYKKGDMAGVAERVGDVALNVLVLAGSLSWISLNPVIPLLATTAKHLIKIYKKAHQEVKPADVYAEDPRIQIAPKKLDLV